MGRPYRTLLAIAVLSLSMTPASAQHKMVDTSGLPQSPYHIYGWEAQILGPQWRLTDLRRNESNSTPTVPVKGEDGVMRRVPISQLDGMRIGGSPAMNAGNPMVEGLDRLSRAGFQANAPMAAPTSANLPNGTRTGIHGSMDTPKLADGGRQRPTAPTVPSGSQAPAVIAKYEQSPISGSSFKQAVPRLQGKMLTPTERFLHNNVN